MLYRELKQGYTVRVGTFLDWEAHVRRWHLSRGLDKQEESAMQRGTEPSRQRGQWCKDPRLTALCLICWPWVPSTEWDSITVEWRMCAVFSRWHIHWHHLFHGRRGCIARWLHRMAVPWFTQPAPTGGCFGCRCSQHPWPLSFDSMILSSVS